MNPLSPDALTYVPPRGLTSKIKRRLVQWQTVTPLPATPQQAIISFTFDDFPRSAAETGGDILDRFGAKGCYYTCTGYVGESGTSGPFFTERNILDLQAAGHEIGAHTVRHMDCAQASLAQALTDISHNLDQLKALGVSGPVRQFAYPYGETSLPLKRALLERFDACRGILSGANRAGNDLMQLRAVELDGDEASLQRAAQMIETAAREPAWLIFFTHGVSKLPGTYDVSSKGLTDLVRKARDSGADLLAPSAALDKIQSQA